MSLHSLEAELSRMASAMRSLKRENAALRKEVELLRGQVAVADGGRPEAPAEGVSFTVSPKGAVSVLGLARLPTTLYRAQWLRVLASAAALRAFLTAHEGVLREPAPPAPRRRPAASRQRLLRLRLAPPRKP